MMRQGVGYGLGSQVPNKQTAVGKAGRDHQSVGVDLGIAMCIIRGWKVLNGDVVWDRDSAEELFRLEVVETPSPVLGSEQTVVSVWVHRTSRHCLLMSRDRIHQALLILLLRIDIPHPTSNERRRDSARASAEQMAAVRCSKGKKETMVTFFL
jgi:hypothetical protein